MYKHLSKCGHARCLLWGVWRSTGVREGQAGERRRLSHQVPSSEAEEMKAGGRRQAGSLESAQAGSASLTSVPDTCSGPELCAHAPGPGEGGPGLAAPPPVPELAGRVVRGRREKEASAGLQRQGAGQREATGHPQGQHARTSAKLYPLCRTDGRTDGCFTCRMFTSFVLL